MVYLSLFYSSSLVMYSPPVNTPVCSSIFGGAVSGRALAAAPWANTHKCAAPAKGCCNSSKSLLSNSRQAFVQDHSFTVPFFFLRYSLLIENNGAKLPVVTSMAGSLQQATSFMLHLPHPTLSSQAVQMANYFYKPFFPPRSSKHLGLATVEM